jgi:hypothetical protein
MKGASPRATARSLPTYVGLAEVRDLFGLGRRVAYELLREAAGRKEGTGRKLRVRLELVLGIWEERCRTGSEKDSPYRYGYVYDRDDKRTAIRSLRVSDARAADAKLREWEREVSRSRLRRLEGVYSPAKPLTGS